MHKTRESLAGCLEISYICSMIEDEDKLIVFVDMDDVLANYQKAHKEKQKKQPWNKYPQSEYDFFRNLEMIEGAKDGMNSLCSCPSLDVWILTRPSVWNPLCYTEKRVWVEENLGMELCHKLIIAPDKAMLKGDFLIDDHPWDKFEGTQLLFGSDDFPDWETVIYYFSGFVEDWN